MSCPDRTVDLLRSLPHVGSASAFSLTPRGARPAQRLMRVTRAVEPCAGEPGGALYLDECEPEDLSRDWLVLTLEEAAAAHRPRAVAPWWPDVRRTYGAVPVVTATEWAREQREKALAPAQDDPAPAQDAQPAAEPAPTAPVVRVGTRVRWTSDEFEWRPFGTVGEVIIINSDDERLPWFVRWSAQDKGWYGPKPVADGDLEVLP